MGFAVPRWVGKYLSGLTGAKVLGLEVLNAVMFANKPKR